jgi:hypothetical protein
MSISVAAMDDLWQLEPMRRSSPDWGCSQKEFHTKSRIQGEAMNASVILHITSVFVGVSYPRECYNIYGMVFRVYAKADVKGQE